MESEDAEVTTSATVPPASPTLDLNLDALDALRISGAIEVIYPAGWQKKGVAILGQAPEGQASED